jgi:hypothetical protein
LERAKKNKAQRKRFLLRSDERTAKRFPKIAEDQQVKKKGGSGMIKPTRRTGITAQ